MLTQWWFQDSVTLSTAHMVSLCVGLEATSSTYLLWKVGHAHLPAPPFPEAWVGLWGISIVTPGLGSMGLGAL